MKKLFNNLRATRAHYLVFGLWSLVFISGCAEFQNRNKPQYDTVQVIDSLVIDENSVPIFPKKAALTTDTARRFSMEIPKRCKVDWENQRVLSVVPEQPVEIARLDKGDHLPEFNVDDYTFQKLTVRDALDRLLEGTKIVVIEDEMMTEKVSGSIKSGTLSDAADLISRLGKAYYSYDEAAKTIHIGHRAKWLMKMPKDQDMIMAILDAMHGANMQNLLVNWEDKTVVFEGNFQTEKEALQIASDIGSRKFIIAWDIDIYRVYPRTDNPIVWMNILPALGEQNVKMSVPGVIGRALVVSPAVNTRTLQEFLGQQSNVVLISQGSFSIPNGWQSRFDIGQCSREERLETDLIIGATGKYGDYAGMKKIDAKIVLRTRKGELTSFKLPTNLGDNYVIVGIPTHSFVNTPETLISPFAELVMFMSPRIVSVSEPLQSAEQPPILSGDALRDYLEE
jgi:hypothetical protein